MPLLKPLVSVIIPTYNRAGLITETLKDVQLQTYQNWECIVVDDGSTDNTRVVVEQVCENDSRFSYIKNQRSKGAPGARNTGLEIAKGEFISFFDSDDKLLSNYIENKITHFITDEKLDLVISLSRWIENGKETFYTNVPTSVHPIIRFYSLYPVNDIPWLTPTLIRKSFLTENKIMWDENVKLHQDIQFNVTMLSKNPNLLWLRKEVDWKWSFIISDTNIGKQKNNEIETSKKLIEVYWNSLQNATIADELKKKVRRQYHAQLVGFCDKLSYSLSDHIHFLQFVAKRSNFTSFDIILLKQRINFKRKLPIGVMQRIFWKFIRFYFNNFYSPIIKKGSFLTHSTLNT